MLVGDAVVAFIVPAGIEVADILYKVLVKLVQTFIGGEDGKVPAAPGEVVLFRFAEELALEYPYHRFCGLVAVGAVFVFPAQKRGCFALYPGFHLAHARIGKVYAALMILEAEELPRLVRPGQGELSSLRESPLLWICVFTVSKYARACCCESARIKMSSEYRK